MHVCYNFGRTIIIRLNGKAPWHSQTPCPWYLPTQTLLPLPYIQKQRRWSLNCHSKWNREKKKTERTKRWACIIGKKYIGLANKWEGTRSKAFRIFWLSTWTCELPPLPLAIPFQKWIRFQMAHHVLQLSLVVSVIDSMQRQTQRTSMPFATQSAIK